MTTKKQFLFNLTGSPWNSILVIFLVLLLPRGGFTQSVSVKENRLTIKTYEFNDPDPVPILTSNPKIYPYHRFEGYRYEGEEQSWEVVSLENDYIEVLVMPDAGGKVWGAIEKSTGEEFIYKNEVMKFRNIAMRGPWTSGGIEFNFGIIGHSPSTASPVDYLLSENEDGSVSCFIGNMDLPSRTQWRIEIRLPKDRAYFETRTLWYNPTPLHQSYYNWMNASAAASDDLEFFYPGNFYLEHSGERKIWPVDPEGREISYYKNNAFGGSKAYHIVGEYNDFFGGYYHNKDFGYGHWALYEEMPGQKLWIWALSRSGGIWEELLTDTDGQYIEFQAGRLFNQYSPGHHINPVRQVGFEPYSTDSWNEIWFPFKDTNGMLDASPFGVLNVEHQENSMLVNINALQKLEDHLVVKSGGTRIFNENIKLNPMEVFSTEIPLENSQDFEIILGDRKLHYSSNTDSIKIKRPFESSEEPLSQNQQLLNEGIDAFNYREYQLAYDCFRKVLDIDPSNISALAALAELHYRKGEYDKTLDMANLVLRQNIYDPYPNYLAGIAYRAKGDAVNALECLGWAARDMKFRSVAYSQMAEIYLLIKDYRQSRKYTEKSLDYNRYNIPAYQVSIVSSRMMQNPEESRKMIDRLLEIDPLNHFARFEKYLLQQDESSLDNFTSLINNEFPEETCLEIALFYRCLGLPEDAIRILESGPEVTKNILWLAYLHYPENPGRSLAYLDKALSQKADFVFPYRIESLEILRWAMSIKDSWKLNYYLALNYSAVGRIDEATELLVSCEDDPDYWVFYLTRANHLKRIDPVKQGEDIMQAWQLDPENWRTWYQRVQYYNENNRFDEALSIAEKGNKKYPENYNIGFSYAKTLLYHGKYEACIDVLHDIVILPFEAAYESRHVFEDAHILLALEYIENKEYDKAINIINNSFEWPESLGVGKPYDPDERKQDFLLCFCYKNTGRMPESEACLKKVVEYTDSFKDQSDPNHILGLVGMSISGKSKMAEELIREINENLRFDGQLREWILAVHRKDESKLRELKINGFDEEPYAMLSRMVNLYHH